MRLIAILVLCLSLPALAADGPEGCVAEPVFGGTACIYTAGPADAPALVLVHGIKGEGLRDWRPVIDALSARYRIVTFDLPGFGASSKESTDYSPANYVRFIRFVVEREGLDRFHLVGHSMGGAIALLYAATYPEQVERLAVASVAGLLHRLTIAKYMFGGWVGKVAGLEGVSATGSRMVGKFLEELEGIPGFDGVMANDEMLREQSRDPTLTAALGLVGQPFADLLDRITAPTLILWGGNDRIAPVRTAHALAFQLPAAELAVLAGAGHMVMLDAPDRFVPRLAEFLERSRAQLPRFRGHGEPAAPPAAVGRIGRCNGQRGMRFSGDYERIELLRCEGVVIENARIGQLSARESRAHVIDSVIVSREAAVQAWGSDLEFTACGLSGAVAFEVSGSRLDVVGCDIRATDVLVRAVRPSNLVFSITRVRAPDTPATLHEFREVGGG